VEPNKVKHRLRQGGLAVGTMVFEFKTTGIGHLAAHAGAEFVIFDMEHTGWTSEDTRTLIATSRAASIVPIVRVPANQYHLVATQLDLGARGIMVPMVESKDAALEFVSFAKYPPQGRRGSAFGIAHDDYAGGSIEDKVATANAETLTIAQIETEAGVASAEEIASVEGLDILWLGQFDLSTFLGVPGRFDDEKFVRSVDQVVDAAVEHGKALGVLVMTVDEARLWIERGFRCIAFGGDSWLYGRALASGLQAVRGLANDAGR